MNIDFIKTFLQHQADFILNILSPVLWCLFFVIIMDRDSFLRNWFMPFLGGLAAFLANSVPIGGGIVYIPALSLLGVDITLGAAFTISVMPIGNGVFGLLRWLMKDPKVIIWESFQYTVLPSWIGSILAMLVFPTPKHAWIKFGFAWLCFGLGILVLLAVYHGGLKNMFQKSSTSHSPTATSHSSHTTPDGTKVQLPTFDDLIQDQEEDIEDNTAITDETTSFLSRSRSNSGNFLDPSNLNSNSLGKWWHVILISFLGGVILVPNIGIGPALITYFLLALMGYPDQQALVTGIVTGGWVCIVPFLLHIFFFQDVPWELWIMVLPGVFYGAKYAPFVIDMIGSQNVMIAFAIFLFASALLYWLH